jgi:Zn finger protein HypA/HybF involved in hydrogenase expression
MHFSCPRCQQPVDERFYGPCPTCRAELHATLGGEARQVERVAFEPAMHVTPNAVALKDD